MKSKAAFEGRHWELTEKVIGMFFDVYNELGYGFSEKVYENAFVIALRERGLKVEQQKELLVHFRGHVVGRYIVDILVNDIVIVELKSVKRLMPEHEAQLMNYLKATEIEVGLLMNFGPEAKFKRKIYDNARKGSLKWIKPQQKTKNP
ncbi:MAG: GxxExxY protein [bacterium]|nr:GxxExxY protein [bacterium]